MKMTTFSQEHALEALSLYGFAGSDTLFRAAHKDTLGAQEARRRVDAGVPGAACVTQITGQDTSTSEIWFAASFAGPNQVRYAEIWAACATYAAHRCHANSVDVNRPSTSKLFKVKYFVDTVQAVDVRPFAVDGVAWLHHIVDVQQTAYPVEVVGEGSKDIETERERERQMRSRGEL
jgi:hypothetical protein